MHILHLDSSEAVRGIGEGVGIDMREQLLDRKAGRCMLANACWPCVGFILSIT